VPALPTLGLLVALSLLAVLSVWAGHRKAQRAFVDLGPTDGRYVHQFREIERDPDSYFRWSVVPSSTLELPLGFCGPGTLRLRTRRHFTDPVELSVFVSGTMVGQRSIQAREDRPFSVEQFIIPNVTCDSNTKVILESLTKNPRPLGVAVDWAEITASEGYIAGPGTLVRGGLVALGLGLALVFTGASQVLVVSAGILLAIALGLGFAHDPIAGERILRGGLAAGSLTLAPLALLSSISHGLRFRPETRLTLVLITVVVVSSRSMFMNPQAFYPDYRVHALVLQTLDSLGLVRFLDQLFEIQYARSLGLQQIAGNWYPFPYPPGAYLIAELVQKIFALDPLDAVVVTGAAASAMIPALCFGLGRLLGVSERSALTAAFFVALQPLLIRRMALGYMPGLVGQAADALTLGLGLLVWQSPGIRARGPAAGFFCVTLAAFLVYTQSIANFGLLILGLLGLSLVTRQTSLLRRAALLGTLAAVGLVAAIGLFYSEYTPVFENVFQGRPQPQSATLDRLEAIRQTSPLTAGAPEEDSAEDAFVGPDFNLARGAARLLARLWLFNGPFSLAILAGLWLLWRQSDSSSRVMIGAWGAVCLWISLLAAGLPGPNGFQHLKDLEFVSPLFAIALGLLAERLWEYRPWAGGAFIAAWLIFVVRAFAVEFSARLLPVMDR